MSVGVICVRSVHVASPRESVRAVSARMSQAGVGSVVVLEADQRPVGVLTDRDIAVRCVAQRRDPDTTEVGTVMSAPPTCVRESTPIETALALMAGVRARRLVVVDDAQRLVGILSIDDVLELLAEEQVSIGKLLRQRARPS